MRLFFLIICSLLISFLLIGEDNNFNSINSNNEILLAKRSGGRMGGSSFSSRKSSSSSSRSSSSSNRSSSSSTRSSGSSYSRGSSSNSSNRTSYSSSSRGSSYKSSSGSSGKYYVASSGSSANIRRVYYNGNSRFVKGIILFSEPLLERYYWVYNKRSSSASTRLIIFFILAVGGFGFLIYFVNKKTPKKSYNTYNTTKSANSSQPNEIYQSLKIQFALHSTADYIRDEIKNIGENLNFENTEDLKKLLSNTSSILIDNSDYIKYGVSLLSEKTKEISKAEEIFENFTFEEHDKLSQETFKKLKGRSITKEMLSEGNKPSFMEIKEYIVFSIIVTFANYEITIEDDYTWESYKSVLEQITKLTSDKIVAVEIIWSPDAENDILTEDDITQYYNKLVQI
ncbi:DUF1517 domain-containing protein [bacterium]|nr:DUF1517 domain-containing protein [bacterium]